jgi:peptidoglycan/LPS O-acetylase OafA/YrhL
MRPLSNSYFRLSVIYSLVGLGIGLMMVSVDDHSQMPTHAHIMLIGFIVMFMFGAFYRLYPDAEKGVLPVLHFAVANLSFVAFMVGFWLIYEGNPELGESFTAPSTTIFIFNHLLFAWIVFRATSNRHQGVGGSFSPGDIPKGDG